MQELWVVAGLVFDADGRVLIAQRPTGKALAGRWEFPGGKVAPMKRRTLRSSGNCGKKSASRRGMPNA
ncbi:MAG: NUDIX domain-containing protein [Proteobacteria bacterium]|nr:NUDIX domain-containing protein [Pseudomonadota bacterium]